MKREKWLLWTLYTCSPWGSWSVNVWKSSSVEKVQPTDEERLAVLKYHYLNPSKNHGFAMTGKSNTWKTEKKIPTYRTIDPKRRDSRLPALWSPETHSKHSYELKPKPISYQFTKNRRRVMEYSQPKPARGNLHKILHQVSPSEPQGEMGWARLCVWQTHVRSFISCY